MELTTTQPPPPTHLREPPMRKNRGGSCLELSHSKYFLFFHFPLLRKHRRVCLGLAYVTEGVLGPRGTLPIEPIVMLAAFASRKKDRTVTFAHPPSIYSLD